MPEFARLRHHVGLELEVLEVVVHHVADIEQVAANAVDHDLAVADLERGRVLVRLPTIQRLAVEQADPAAGRRAIGRSRITTSQQKSHEPQPTDVLHGNHSPWKLRWTRPRYRGVVLRRFEVRRGVLVQPLGENKRCPAILIDNNRRVNKKLATCAYATCASGRSFHCSSKKSAATILPGKRLSGGVSADRRSPSLAASAPDGHCSNSHTLDT